MKITDVRLIPVPVRDSLAFRLTFQDEKGGERFYQTEIKRGSNRIEVADALSMMVHNLQQEAETLSNLPF